jgi:argininosuccinate lyase
MDQLSQADLQSVDERLGSDFVFDVEKSVEMRTAKGGTSRGCVREQIRVLKGMLVGGSHQMSSDESFS